MNGIPTYAASKHALYAPNFFSPYPCDVSKNKVLY